MSTENNKVLNRRLVEEGINRGSSSALDELIARDIVDHAVENLRPPMSGLPDTGSPSSLYPKGREGVKQFFADWRRAFPDLHYTIVDTISEGDQVVARSYWEGTNKGEFMGLAPTGKRVRVDQIDISRFSDGKIVEHWGSTDVMGLMQQLGLSNMP